MTDKWSQQGEHYSPTKCEFCNCYMPRQVKYDEDSDIVGFITKCTPCTPVAYTHLRGHKIVLDFVFRFLLEKKIDNEDTATDNT